MKEHPEYVDKVHMIQYNYNQNHVNLEEQSAYEDDCNEIAKRINEEFPGSITFKMFKEMLEFKFR